MSWDDFTNAKVYGTRICRPASDILSAIDSAIAARMYAVPQLSRSYVALDRRDILLLRDENMTLLAISRTAERHLPYHVYRHVTRCVESWEGGRVGKPQILRSAGIAEQVILELAYDRFVEPLVLILPPDFFETVVRPGAEIMAVGELIFQNELDIYMENQERAKPKKIFLSHKSKNKELVRDVAKTLKEIGLDPWLDEDAMPAGSNLYRAIPKGMEDSCAVVFFITPDFKDEDWVEMELDLALVEKQKKKDRFAIVPLLLTSSDGQRGSIANIIEKYVHIDVQNHQIVLEILRAIPIRPTSIDWKLGV